MFGLILRQAKYKVLDNPFIFISLVILLQLVFFFNFNEDHFHEKKSILQLSKDDPHSSKKYHHSHNDHQGSQISLHAVFFNVFLNEDSTTGRDIALEQFKYIEMSPFSATPIYYTTIGKLPNVSLCASSVCHNTVHLKEGGESATLRPLSEYCRANPTHTVAYIHNKGSFTPSKENTLLRRMHMKALFDPEGCASTRPEACNVCSARFSPLPHFHTSGNMFVAGCDYVGKLIPPEIFAIKMFNTLREGFLAPESIFLPSSKLQTQYIDLDGLRNNFYFGTGRYAYEHWIHSHPSVAPCDVYPGPFTWNYENIPSDSNWAPDLQMAPRFPLKSFWVAGIHLEPEPWFLLEGRKFEWKMLYDAQPPFGSWIEGLY
mmetsp:Transcript_9582/g.17387  ORF Transcript_9582/g.17387 Transcript_9582/m.17387 type:complete len:373 (-) Transcript_9582:81-1199(-)